MGRALVRVALACASAALVATAARAAAQSVSPVDLSGIPAAAEQKDPAVAFDGTSFLLVWEEGLRVWGAQLGVGGGLMGPPIAIAHPADGLTAQLTPAVAAGAAGGFLVVWTEDAGGASQADIRGARVSAAGAVLDVAGFDVSTVVTSVIAEPAPGPQVHPAVAASGTDFFVVWEDGRDDPAVPAVFGAGVDAGGNVLHPDGVALSLHLSVQRRPSIAWNGTSYLVAWEDAPVAGAYDIYGVRVDAAGLPEADFPISSAAGDQREPSVASNGAAYLVAWNDQRSGTSWDLTAARVDGTGVLDPGGIVIAGVDASAPHAISSDGSGYLVAYERSGSGAVAKRVGAGGAVGPELTVDATVVSPGQALAFAGLGRHLAVHREDVSGTVRLAAALVTTVERLDVARAGSGFGSVTSTPAGVDCGATCGADFETGSDVLLSASADPGSSFGSWSGCPSPSGASCTITMSAPASVTATFALDVPGAPGVPTYDPVGSTSLTVSWTAAPGATSHELERAPDAGGGPGAYAQVFAGAATSYADAGLAANTAYWYRVRGANAGGAGAYSTATSVTTLPAAPATPTFGGLTATSVTVAWTAPVGGASAYEVERASSAGTDWVVVTTTGGLSYVDATLAAATTYLYRVRATNATGAGAYSATASVTTLPLPPAAPGAPTYSNIGATSVTVSWGAVTGATDYDLERGPSSTGPWTAAATDVTATSHVDATLSENTTYWYRVRASNSGGDGAFSAASSVTTLAGAPGAPTFDGVTETSLVVHWTAPAGTVDGYDVERGTSATGPWTPVATGVVGLLVADAGPLAAGTIYWYRVRAVTSAGAGAYSAASQVVTLPGAPGTPTFGSIATTSLVVSWGAVTGAATYGVERAPDDGTGAPAAWAQIASGVGATSYPDGGLAKNVRYWYRVRAVNAWGTGAFSAAASVVTMPDPPGTPTFASVATTSLSVSWTPPPDGGAATYDLDRGTSATGPWTSLAIATAALGYSDSGLTAGTTYWYRVRAANADGLRGAYSAASVSTVPGAAAAPTYSGIGATSVTVSWGTVSGATSYDLDRGPSATGPWTAVAVDVTATSRVDATLSANTTYWYRVRASNASGDGTYSSASSVTTLPGVPGTPAFSGLTASGVTVSWAAPAGGAATYKLERALAAAGPWTQIAAGIAATTYPDGGLSSNVTYWYRVRATNPSGDGAYSPAASVTTIAGAPGTPTFSAITTTSVVVSWAAPTGGATSYDLERATSAGGPFASVTTGLAALSYADSGLAVGTPYWYRVRANTLAGPSAWSGVAQVFTLPGAPGDPTFTNIAATSLTVSWTAPAGGADSYKVERAPDNGADAPGAWTQVAAGVGGTTYPSAGLTANTKYWYRVRATNASGDGAYSPQASVVTLPAPPGVPAFSAVTTTSLTVSWAAPAGGAASYDLDRGATATGPWTSLAVATTVRTFSDAVLAAGTTYWYRVRATNSTGLSSAYSTASVPTLPDAPGAPTASPAVFTVTVSWSPVTGATSYKLERAPDDGTGNPGTWTQIATVAASPYTDTGRSPNTTYWYRLRASNSSGDGAYSPATKTITLPNAPGQPTFTSVTSSSLTVSWTAPAGGAASYEIERATSALGPWTQLATGVVGLSQGDSGLTAGTIYFYRVRAANSAGAFGAWSPFASVTTLPSSPGALWFTGIAALSLTVNWNPISGADVYSIERAPDNAGQPGAWAPLDDGLIETFYNDATSPNTVYWYRVRGWNESGYGGYSPANSTATLPGAPGAPTFTNVSPTSVTVSWTAPAGGAAGGYVVERATSALGPWTVVASGVSGLSYDDGGLSPEMTYWYAIRAVNATGAIGSPSPIAAVTTLPLAPSGAPAAPTFSGIGTTSVTVHWTGVSGATSYQLERAPDAGGAPGAWMQIASVASPGYPDTGLAANTGYWYRVRASTAGGPGPWSAASPVVTLPNAPGAPTFASVTATSVAVSWAAPAGGAASYELQRAPTAVGPWEAPVVVVAPSAVDSGLLSGTTYWYRVRARNSAGGAGAYSPAASVTTLTSAPGAPLYLNVGVTSLTVVWSPAPGAASYQLERGPTSTGSWSQLGGAIAGTSYLDSSVTANTTYWYRVCAVNGAGVPGACSAASTTTTLPGAPGTPTFTSIATTSLTVGWTAPAGGAASYKVERAASATGPWTLRASGIVGLAFADSGLAANTTYHYRVRATNVLNRDGPYSASAAVTTSPDGSTAAPGALAAPTYGSVSTTGVVVIWSSATGATLYELERAPDAGGAPGATWTHVGSTTWTSYLDGGLTANTITWYRVRATNAGGSTTSPASSIITAPNAPGPPTFGSVAITSLTVSWTVPVGGAASYEIERAVSPLGPWTQLAAGVVATSYPDTGLVGGTLYYYRLRATNAAGRDSVYTGWRSVATLVDPTAPVPGVPGAPTFTSILASSVKVSWTPAVDATSYKLERAAASAGPWTQIAATAATSFTDNGRAANTAYWYRVRASNGAVDGAYSPTSSVITAPNAPGAPTFSSVAATEITVSWAAPFGGAATYRIERATGSGSWVEIASGVAGLSFVSAGLTGNTTYSYRVRATNSAGVDGYYSAARSVTTLPDASASVPGAPGAPTYSNVYADALIVSWAAAPDATSYRLERAAAAGGPWLQIALTTATRFVDTRRSANTTYWYRVRGENLGGAGPYSPETSVTTAPNAPGPPTFTSVTASTVSMSWTPPYGGAASYEVERATGSNGPWVVVGTGLTTPAFTDPGLTGNTLLYYRVRGTNADGLDGVPSYVRSVLTAPDVTVAAPDAPGAPTYSGIYAAAVTVSWTSAARATSYRLERAGAPSGPWTEIASLTGTSFFDTWRTANTTYWYRVRGSNAGGDGPYSTVSQVTTAPNAPGAPTFSAVATTSLTASWSAPLGGAASYAIERKTSTAVSWTPVASGLASLDLDDAGLTPGTTYFYRVRAANADGVYGAYSAARSVTTAAVPGL